MTKSRILSAERPSGSLVQLVEERAIPKIRRYEVVCERVGDNIRIRESRELDGTKVFVKDGQYTDYDFMKIQSPLLYRDHGIEAGDG